MNLSFEQLSFFVLHSLVHLIWLGLLVCLIAIVGNRFLQRRSPTAEYRFSLLCFLLLVVSVPVSASVALVTMSSDLTSGVTSPAISVSTESRKERSGQVADSLIKVEKHTAAVQNDTSSTSPTSEAELQIANDKPALNSIDSGSSTAGYSISKIAKTMAPCVSLGYLIGSFLMLFRIALSSVGVQRLVRASKPIRDREIVLRARRIAGRLGLDVTPVLMICNRVTVPMVFGIWRPVILLPTSLITNIPPVQLDAILAHEMSHLRQFDHLIVIGQRLMEAILFFHPVTWWLSRRLDWQREICCDDRVLEVGTSPLDYAKSLYHIAKMQMSARQKSQGLGVAADGGQASQLGTRISRVLGETPQTSFKASSNFGLLFLILSLPVALVCGTLLAHGDLELASSGESSILPVVSESEIATDEAYPEFRGVLRDSAGNPIAGAKVVIQEHPLKCHGYVNRLLPTSEEELSKESKYDLKVLAETDSGRDGTFQLKDVPVPDFAPYYGSRYPITLVVIHDEFALQWVTLSHVPERELEITLSEPNPVSIKFTSLGDLEVRESDVKLVGVMVAEEGMELQLAGNVDNSSRNMMNYWLSNDSSNQLANRMIKRDGAKLELKNLPPNSIAVFDVMARGSLRETICVSNIAERTVERATALGRSRTIHLSPAEIRLSEAASLHITVLEKKTGDPIPGASVELMQRSDEQRNVRKRRSAKTDQLGIVEFQGLNPDAEQIYLVVDPPIGSQGLRFVKRFDLSPDEMKQPIEIAVESGVKIQGKVIDLETGQGIPGVDAYLDSSVGDLHENQVATMGTTDANGDYEIVVPKRSAEAKGEVSIGPVEGYISLNEMEPDNPFTDYATVPVDLADAKIVPTIRLKSIPKFPQQYMEVTVVDENDQPVSGVAVRFFGHEKNGGYSTPASQKTNSAGIVQLEQNEYGPFYYKRLAVTAIDLTNKRAGALVHEDSEELKLIDDLPSYLECLIAAKKSPEGPSVGLTIKLQPMAKVEGRLVNENDDSPIVGAQVVCYQLPYEFTEFTPHQMYFQPVETDDDGHFELSAIPDKKGFLLFSRGPFANQTLKHSASEKFVLESGETKKVNHRVEMK